MRIFRERQLQLHQVALARPDRCRSSLIWAGVAHASCCAAALPLGIDFSGGTAIVLQVRRSRRPRTWCARRSTPVSKDAVVQTVRRRRRRTQIMVRLPMMKGRRRAPTSRPARRRSNEALRAANVGQFTIVEQGHRRPRRWARTSGRKGICATLAALGGILVYVGFRFRFTFAVGAIVATFHDILITLVVPDAGSATTCR